MHLRYDENTKDNVVRLRVLSLQLVWVLVVIPARSHAMLSQALAGFSSTILGLSNFSGDIAKTVELQICLIWVILIDGAVRWWHEAAQTCWRDPP